MKIKRNRNGKTLFHIAAEKNLSRIVEFLCTRQDLLLTFSYIENGKEYDALDCALKSEVACDDVASYLIRKLKKKYDVKPGENHVWVNISVLQSLAPTMKKHTILISKGGSGLSPLVEKMDKSAALFIQKPCIERWHICRISGWKFLYSSNWYNSDTKEITINERSNECLSCIVTHSLTMTIANKTFKIKTFQ